jgi:hypothetical protein
VHAILFALLFLWSGTHAALSQRPLKVRIQYEFDAEAYQADRRTARKQLTNVSWYDRAGREAERWDIEDNNGSPRYNRNVFTYDRAGRKTAHLEHTSSTLTAGQHFSILRTEGGVKVVPQSRTALPK